MVLLFFFIYGYCPVSLKFSAEGYLTQNGQTIRINTIKAVYALYFGQ